MLSYEHIYHAGNHADIVKHITLTLILERLLQKDKPFTVYDTHAGIGYYDLTDSRAQKTNEAENGIRRLLQADTSKEERTELPSGVTTYLNLCRMYAADEHYPGSPEIARNLLRPDDALILSELHPQAINILRTTMKIPPLAKKEQKHVIPQIHYRNGFEMLSALTPPMTKRGMAIIDPSFEETQDFSDCADTICAVHQKWAGGILALWYPLLEHRRRRA